MSTSTLSALAVALAGLLLSACPAPTPKPPAPPPKRGPTKPGRVEQRYDAARRMTLLRVRPPAPPPKGHSLALVAAGGFPGRIPATYSGVLMGLRSAADRRFWIEDCRTIELHAGGRSLGSFGATRETEIGAGWLAEYVLAVVPFTRVFAFVSGSEPTLAACSFKHPLTVAELGRLRQLVTALRPAR
ncbi:MAG: hypothetical protein CSA65_09635 [Proteobacteria bacterium]|nr:MAG: hypothetical protein CSB49_01240 [Pseudomonadota bacterium]PIE17129.1 MAG: hypothetical protein CSA65_09635 [Pseudomonadota bacterium]